MSRVQPARTQPPTPDQLAGTGRRVLALLVDQVVALAVASVAVSIGYGIALESVRSAGDGEASPAVGVMLLLPLVALAVLGVAQWVAEARTGRTLGNLVLGIRTVGVEDGAPVGLGRVFVRSFVVGLGSLVLGVGQYVVAASPAWDASGRVQGWHDRAARTLVVRTRGASGAAARPARASSAGRDSTRTPPPVPARVIPAPRADAPRPAAPPTSGGSSIGLPRVAWAAADDPSASAPTEPWRAPDVPTDEPGEGHDPSRPGGTGGTALPGVEGIPAPRVPGGPDPVRPDGAQDGPVEAAPVTGSVPEQRTPVPPADDVITSVPRWWDSGDGAGDGAGEGRGAGGAPPTTPSGPTRPTGDAPAGPPDPPVTAPTRRARREHGPETSSVPMVPTPFRPPTGALPPASSGTRTGGVRLVFDTGEVVTVVGPGSVGRNPAPPPGARADHVVPIDDPARSVSKTHLEFGLEDGDLWVVDRRSTNGSVLVEPDGSRRRLEPGVRTSVPRGSVVEFGDRRVQVVGT